YVPKSYAEKYNIPLDNPWVKEEEDRKPGIGMLKKACVDLGLKLEDCDVWYVGDKPADVLTGLNAGGRGIMVHNGGEHERVAETEKLVSEHPGKVFIVTSLGEAARIILDNV
ncbi:MAG: HAD hydrolase-like protein, partial [Candidatus Nanoarchaeia archaeon]